MRSFWMKRVSVNKGGLDLSKEVLWVSLGQRAAHLQAVKVGGQKKILPIGQGRTHFARAGPIGRILCWPPTLTACRSGALWPTETHSTSLERSKPLLLTQSMSKSLAALLINFIAIQRDIISIVLTRTGVNISTWKGKLFPRSFLKIRNSTQTISKNFHVFGVKATSRPGIFPKFLQVWQTVPESNSHLLIDLFTPEGTVE